MLPVSVPEDFDEGQLQESSSDADVSVAESTAATLHPAEVLASEAGKQVLSARAVSRWPLLPISLPAAARQPSCFSPGYCF